ncbi:MAG: hypothetical protein ACREME_02540 [Gemmatimonadales bacterium]
MRRALGVIMTAMVIQPPNPAAAQDVAIGPQVVFGDYREVSADLHYRGAGVGGAASVTWKQFGADVAFFALAYEPTDDGTATQAFDATQLDMRLRYYVTGPVSAELGIVNRDVDPEFEAQSLGAVSAGARLAYVLGPGVRMNLRGALLFGAKFSGGGTSSPLGAMELGLSVGVDALRGRLRLTGNYDFQRITRETDDGSGEVEVPIQQSLGRVGVAIVF